jgi:hypothetical protein
VLIRGRGGGRIPSIPAGAALVAINGQVR